MDYVVDTNILLVLIQDGHSKMQEVWSVLDSFEHQGIRGCVLMQNLVEFWNVCTRPIDVNGLGLGSAETLVRLDTVESLFYRLPDSGVAYPIWRELVIQNDVRGKQVHDARIVAAMQVHGVLDILTYNAADFKRYSSIRVLDPAKAT